MRPYCFFAFAVAWLPSLSMAGGLSPEESLSRFQVADGFRIKLFASEPQIRQPVTMSFDSRGRMWVVQYLQYPTPNGLKPVEVDRFLRTKYDKVPEPPPHGPKGADRVTICEDSDGDGQADKFKDFVTGLNLASGLALGHGGAYVLQPPYLLFYPDRNSDDVPDSDPEVLLTGFGMEDAHAVANSLQFGPDGWLYGAQGSTVTANIRGIEFQQGIWRYHPVTKQFELFAEGGGNTWGVDFDRHGQLIAGTNFGGVAGLHQVQGAYYVKNFGKHGALHNPYAFGYFDHMPYSEPQHIQQGEHIMAGGVLYQGGAFPEQYNDRYVTCAVLHRAIYWHNIEPNGSSFKTGWGGKLVTTDDTWFRPIDLCIGPDGSVFIADWYDVRANHVDPHDTWDRSNGRIYKIEPDGIKQTPPIDLAKKSSQQLVELLTHDNVWYRRHARGILAERRDEDAYDALRELVLNSSDERTGLEALWTLYASGGFDPQLAEKLLDRPSPHLRAWTIRLLGDEKSISASIQSRLVALASTEPSPIVRNQLACTSKRLPVSDALPILRNLLARSEDVTDPQIPLLLWWAVEAKVTEDRQAVLTMLDEATVWNLPLVSQFITERLARRFAAEGGSGGLTACAALLRKAPAAEQQRILLEGMEKELAGRAVTEAPEELKNILAEIWNRGEPSPTLIRLAARIGFGPARERALQLATSAATPAGDRAQFIELVGLLQGSTSVPALLEMIESEKDGALQSAALKVLERFSEDQIATRLLQYYPKANAQLRSQFRQVLIGRPSSTLALLTAVDSGTIDPKDLSVDQVQAVLLHSSGPDSPIAKLAQKHWGSVRAITPGEVTARINAVNHDLNRLGLGDAVRGKPVFAKHCATCHTLFNEGNKVGPELTGADRANRLLMLENIVNPSGQVRPEYIAYTVLTNDGRVLTGLMAESTPRSVTLLDAKNERTTIDREEIDQIKPSEASLMPEKILDQLSTDEIRDLFAYLQSGLKK